MNDKTVSCLLRQREALKTALLKAYVERAKVALEGWNELSDDDSKELFAELGGDQIATVAANATTT